MLDGRPGTPHLATFGSAWGWDNHRTSTDLVPLTDITELKPWGLAEAGLELVVLPTKAAAYLGPDSTFRGMLDCDADTWRPVHREGPVTFTGLTSAQGHRVMVNGQPLNAWQTDWNAATQRWQIVCNVPAGGGSGIEIHLDDAK